MSRGGVLFVDVHNEVWADLASRFLDAGLSVIANGPFAGQLEGMESWESFEPPHASGVIQQDQVSFVEGLTEKIQTTEGQLPFQHRGGTFLARTGSRFLQDLVNFRATQVRAVATLEALHRKRNLKLILLACDNSHFQRTLVLHARTLGITTVQLAHSIYGSFTCLNYAANMDTVYADYIVSFGSLASEHIVKLGNAPERILNGGSPLWDALHQGAATPDRNEARRQCGLHGDRAVVLVTFGYAEAGSAFFRQMTEAYLAWNNALCRTMAELGEQVQFLLRPHPVEVGRSGATPEEQEVVLKAFVRWMESRSGVKPHLSLGELDLAIKAADVVVVTDSSSIHGAAMHLGRPTINVPLFSQETPTYGWEEGVLSADFDNLGRQIRRLLGDDRLLEEVFERHARALPRLNAGFPGRSLERIAASLLALMEEGGVTGGDDEADVEELVRKGCHEEALMVLSQRIATCSDDIQRAEWLNDRGVLWFQQGAHERALEDLLASLGLNPLNETIQKNLLTLLQDEGFRAALALTSPNIRS